MLPQSTSPMRPSPLRQSWNPSQSSSSSLGSLQPESLTDSTPRLYIDGEGRASVKQHHLQQPQQQQHQGSVNHSGLPTLKASKSLLIDPSDAALTQLLGQNPFNNGHIPAPSQQLPSQTASFSHPPPPSKPHGTPHPSLTTPFPPTTQFFILDSAGNDPSGLATYTALPPHDDNLTVHPVTGERLYYLVAAPTVFRASESRLLPVGYKCGDTVKQKANVVGSRVVRRYVVGRERRYDLKDELGCVWKDVAEGELMTRAEGLHGVQCGWGRGTGKNVDGLSNDANAVKMEDAGPNGGRRERDIDMKMD